MGGKRIVGFVITGLFLGGGLSACALQSDLVDLETQVHRLEQQIQAGGGGRGAPNLESRLEALERVVQERVALMQKAQTENLLRMDQMAEDLRAIRGHLEENQHLLEELSKNLEEQAFRLSDLERRVTLLERRLQTQPPAATPTPTPKPAPEKAPKDRILLPGGAPSSLVTPPPVSGEAQTARLPAPSPPAPPPGLSPRELYNRAYQDYLQGDFDLALVGFQQYLKQYPDSSLAPNAQYWIGECYYSKGEYDRAIQAFLEVAQRYPESGKVPSALLKAAFSYQKLGQREQAVTYLKRVVAEFPFSQEARLAKIRLAELR